jgi:hypothetical protein
MSIHSLVRVRSLGLGSHHFFSGRERSLAQSSGNTAKELIRPSEHFLFTEQF